MNGLFTESDDSFSESPCLYSSRTIWAFVPPNPNELTPILNGSFFLSNFIVSPGNFVFAPSFIFGFNVLKFLLEWIFFVFRVNRA